MNRLIKILFLSLFLFIAFGTIVYTANADINKVLTNSESLEKLSSSPATIISMNGISGIVKLRPIARRIDENGYELQKIDDNWAVREVGSGIEIRNLRTDHIKIIPKAYVKSFSAGYLILKVQVFISGNRLWFETIR